MKPNVYVILLFTFFTLNTFASQTRKVLIIGMDGARSDAFQQANTPNLDALIANGLFTYDAWHCGITVSGPSWSTIMTGVWWNKHGISSNAYTGSNFNTYPYFTTRAKEIKPNLKCIEVCEWPPLIDNVYNDSWDVKLKTPDGDGASTATVAAAQLADPDVDAMFVYFDAVDLTGHSSGFSPTNPSYIQAIENVDANIGTVLTALYARPNYASENWLILLTPDHGGIGTGHGGITWEERHIWWIASGPAVAHQQITSQDPGTYNLLGLGIFNQSGVNQTTLKQSPVQADIAVTALHHLIYDSGINPEDQAAWNLDGKSWLAAFSGVEEQTEKSVTVFPNPTNGITTLWFENPNKNCVSYQVYDVVGKLVDESANIDAVNKINIDLSGKAKGNYLVKLTIGKEELVKKIIVE